MRLARWTLHDTQIAQGARAMKIGIEQDPVEMLDREEERAIAKAVKARFGQGDATAALREVDRLAKRRLNMYAQVTRLHA